MPKISDLKAFLRRKLQDEKASALDLCLITNVPAPGAFRFG
jgi:hypothetical protein